MALDNTGGRRTERVRRMRSDARATDAATISATAAVRFVGAVNAHTGSVTDVLLALIER